MEKELIQSALKKAKESSPKRNFKQSIDLILNLRWLDLKKPEHQINMFIALPHNTGRNISVCAFVDADMEPKAKDACDETISVDKFERYKGKQLIKQLASKHSFFIAQASIMPKVATAFGRVLGPRGKMPNPKIGGVLQSNTNLKQLCGTLKTTVNLVTKNEPTIKCRVGNEDTPDDKIIENVLAVYNNIVPKLPNDKQNVKNAMLKLTMGPAVVIGGIIAEDETDKKSLSSKKSAKVQK